MKIDEMTEFLFYVAEYGAFNENVEIKTTEFAEVYGMSQQTASRKIIELEKKGYIQRHKTQRGFKIILTDEGRKILEDINKRLNSIIKRIPKSIEMTGILETGMGEGGFYITKKGYKEQFLKKLNFKDLYPGTLNLRLVNEKEIKKRKLLESKKYPGIEIDGWKDEQRTYGAVTCYKARINNSIEGAVLIIQRTSHTQDILEIIAPIYLRKELKLQDGDDVKIEVFFNSN